MQIESFVKFSSPESMGWKCCNNCTADIAAHFIVVLANINKVRKKKKWEDKMLSGFFQISDCAI